MADRIRAEITEGGTAIVATLRDMPGLIVRFSNVTHNTVVSEGSSEVTTKIKEE